MIDQSSSQPASTRRSPSRAVWAIREGLAALLWTFLFVKLFAYDIDVFLLERFAPNLRPLLAFKFFAIIASVAFLWLVLGNQRFRSFVAYVLFYPLVILLWKIPKSLFRNWAVTIAFSPALYSLITTFRSRFIIGTFAILSALAITVSQNAALLITAMVVLGIYLCAHYAQRFRIAFQPSNVFTDIAQLVRKLWQHFREIAVEKELRAVAELDPNSDEYKEKHRQNLSNMFIQILMLRFLAGRLREVAASRKMDLYFIVALVYTFLLTAVIFAFQYSALEKVAPGSFQLPGSPSFWTFLAFSFGTLLPSDFSRVFPHSPTAAVMAYLELASGFVMVIIFVSVLFAILRERYREDIDKVIEELNRSADTLDALIHREYRLSLEEAEAALVEANPDLVKTITLFRGSRQPPENHKEDGLGDA